MNNIGPYIALFISYLVVGISLRSLWRSMATPRYKVIWSFFLLVPLLGLVFFWFIFNAPPSQPGHKRQGVSRYVADGAEERINRDHGVK